KATTQALQHLHYHGLLRVVGRRDGIRIYEAAVPHGEPLSPDERSRQIVLLVVGILAPLAEAGLASTFGLLSRGAPGLTSWRKTVEAMVASGELESGEVDGERYFWPAGAATRRSAPDTVRLLAPFDPIVWERRRFEHLWGWEYRFEAYTKPELRRFGYYAMPLLWRDAIIGWANVRITDGKLDADVGFVGTRPKDAAFRQALDAELAAMESFLT
ncbi:MAG TPA: crosslink repair DNA glycosylase YcaQ family protein, partial [Acetobacteraceae bacterium]|nr:crosslink repair DNA glycosylase YcaQ family protein [Acetobacteraceae bacterium]